MALHLDSTDMLRHWRRVSLSSDFLAKYYSFYLQLEVSNSVTEQLAEDFLASMREVLSGNTEELYISKLEANLQEARSDSGLGFLTLINDYQIALGFKFEKTGAGISRITVQADMNCEEA